MKTLTYTVHHLYAEVKNLCLVFIFHYKDVGCIFKVSVWMFSILKFCIPNQCSKCCWFHRGAHSIQKKHNLKPEFYDISATKWLILKNFQIWIKNSRKTNLCSQRKQNQQRLALKACKNWCTKVHSNFPNAGLEDKAGPKSHNNISSKVTTCSTYVH